MARSAQNEADSEESEREEPDVGDVNRQEIAGIAAHPRTRRQAATSAVTQSKPQLNKKPATKAAKQAAKATGALDPAELADHAQPSSSRRASKSLVRTARNYDIPSKNNAVDVDQNFTDDQLAGSEGNDYGEHTDGYSTASGENMDRRNVRKSSDPYDVIRNLRDENRELLNYVRKLHARYENGRTVDDRRKISNGMRNFDSEGMVRGQRYLKDTVILIDTLAKKCPKFDADQHRDFNVHLKSVQAKCSGYALDLAVMRQLLPETLVGEARVYYETCLAKRDLNYADLCRELIAQYAPANPLDHHEKELRQFWRSGMNMVAFTQAKLDAVCELHSSGTVADYKTCKAKTYQYILDALPAEFAEPAAQHTRYGDYDGLTEYLNKMMRLKKSFAENYKTAAAAVAESVEDSDAKCFECGSLEHFRKRCVIYIKRMVEYMDANDGELPPIKNKYADI